MNNIVQFQNKSIKTTAFNGQIWLSSQELAKGLGYADESSVNRIYSRHTDEFTNEMTCSVKLTDDKTAKACRAFSPRGCHLIAMFARTPFAKEFRKWVLDVLEKLNQPVCSPAQQELGLVPVSSYTRRLPSKPKEIKLSEKARQEVGGIVKTVVKKALDEYLPAVSLTSVLYNTDEILSKESFSPDEIKDYLYSLIAYTGNSNNKEMHKLYIVLGAIKNLLVNYEEISNHTVLYLNPLFKRNTGKNFNVLLHNVCVLHKHNMNCCVRGGR